MFVRSTTAGDDAYCVNADVEAHTFQTDGPAVDCGGHRMPRASALWLAVDGGRALVVANTNEDRMAE